VLRLPGLQAEPLLSAMEEHGALAPTGPFSRP
jgi:hypothetical protein